MCRAAASLLQTMWSFGLLMTFLLQVPMKLDTKNMPSHPAFMLQPCHVSAVRHHHPLPS